MLYGLPTELTLNVLSQLPIPSLLSLRLLSRQWSDFVTAHQSVIFHGAALYHGYILPGTGLEDVLSVTRDTGRPLAGTTTWKDICKSHPCHFWRLSFHALKHFSGCTNCELVNLKAAGSFKYAGTGWEKVLLSRACFCLQPSTHTASRLTRRQGYAS